MLSLNNLESTSKKRKRIGRGGDKGGTSGRGHKGQLARTGGSHKLGASFEGGQMPLVRRLPKKGFNNTRFKKEYKLVNLQVLEENFSSGDIVSIETLTQKSLIKGKGNFFVKILGDGNLNKNLTIKVHRISESAKEQVERAGGKVELVSEA